MRLVVNSPVSGMKPGTWIKNESKGSDSNETEAKPIESDLLDQQMSEVEGKPMRHLTKYLGVLVAAALWFSWGTASALLITTGPDAGANPGSIDTLVGYGRTPNSNLTTETAFVNSVTGESFNASNSEKICDGSSDCASILFDTDQAGVFAIDLPDEPAYFLIKTGAGSSLSQSGTYACDGSNNGGGDDCDHFVFKNLSLAQYGVFNFADMGFDTITSISKISHVDQFGGTTSVPEPNSLALMGAGLLIFGMLLRRKRA